MLQAAPSLVQVFLVFLLPESPRWLVSRGKNEEALQILARYHANGNSEDPFVQFEFAEMQATIKLGEQSGRWKDLVATSKPHPYILIMYLHTDICNRGKPQTCLPLSLLWCLCPVLRHQSDRILPAQYPRGHRYRQSQLPEQAQWIHPDG